MLEERNDGSNKGHNILLIRLMHDDPVALHVVTSLGWLPLGDLADEQVVGSWSGAGADAKEGIERGMPGSASIEAEHELIEVVLEVGLSQSVVNAQAPALEIGEQAMDPAMASPAHAKRAMTLH
jgi:hypothetical protein